MMAYDWSALPEPFGALATRHPAPLVDMPCHLARLLEDIAGVAGTLAAATTVEEADQDAVRFAARVLAAYTQSAVVLWGEWCEAVEEAPTRAPASVPARDV